ncbi:IS3 family transposase [Planococcus sp. 1R117A]
MPNQCHWKTKFKDYSYYYNYIRSFQKLNCHSPSEYRTMAA